ncbi:hypothetical protein BG03_5667 (plasmid) [Bacillus cereus]|nr:hypothetical protein BG03_5667 [Bacillus cereus]
MPQTLRILVALLIQPPFHPLPKREGLSRSGRAVKTEAGSIDKETLYIEAYVELINHKFVISELAVELSSVLKGLNCFVQSSLPQLQSKLDSQEPQSASL